MSLDLRKIVLFFFLFQVSALAEMKFPKPEIRINPFIEVASNSTVSLREMAATGFIGAQEMKSLLSIEIMEALNEEQEVTFKNQDLIKIIREKIGAVYDLNEHKFSLFVPEQVTIKAKRNLIPSMAVINEINSALASKCLDCVVAIKDLKIPMINEKTNYNQCQYDFEQIRGGGSFLLPVHCYFQGNKKSYWITGQIGLSKLGPVTSRQIQSGEKINESDIRMEFIDVTFAKDSLAGAKEFNGFLANRTLMAGQPVFMGDLKRELAITRGQILKAISGNETFEVSAQVQADESGYIGDFIKVKTLDKNMDQQKALSAKVIDKGIVRVE